MYKVVVVKLMPCHKECQRIFSNLSMGETPSLVYKNDLAENIDFRMVIEQFRQTYVQEIWQSLDSTSFNCNSLNLNPAQLIFFL